MSTKRKTRLVGVALGLLGNAFLFASSREAQASGHFSGKMAILGPFFVACGLCCMIEAPPISVKRPSVFGWTLTLAGLVLGLLDAEWLKGGGTDAGPWN